MGKACKHIILIVWLFSFSVSCFGISVSEHTCNYSGHTSTTVGAFISADTFADNCCSDKPAKAVSMKSDCCSDKDQYFKLEVIKKHDEERHHKLVSVPLSLPVAGPVFIVALPVVTHPCVITPPLPTGRQLLSLVQVSRI